MKLFDFLIVINLETFLDLSRFLENLGKLEMFLYYIFFYLQNLYFIIWDFNIGSYIYINTVYIDFLLLK